MIDDILAQTARDYPRAWQRAHRSSDPARWDFIILAVDRLYAANPNWRGNWRRGVVGDLSMDGISVLVDGQWRFADIIMGAGGSNPTLSYREPGPGASLKNSAGDYIGEAGAPTPAQIREHHGGTYHSYTDTEPPPPPPPAPVVCKFVGTDLSGLIQELRAVYALAAAISAEQEHVRSAMGTHTAMFVDMTNRLENLSQRLSDGLSVDAKINVRTGGVTGSIKG